jgi:Flp pilus assembly pilin Flp
MKYLVEWLKVRSKRGVSAIEYGLLAALISLVIVAGVSKISWSLTLILKRLNASF